MRRFPQYKGSVTDLRIGGIVKPELDVVFEAINGMQDEEKRSA